MKVIALFGVMLVVVAVVTADKKKETPATDAADGDASSDGTGGLADILEFLKALGIDLSPDAPTDDEETPDASTDEEGTPDETKPGNGKPDKQKPGNGKPDKQKPGKNNPKKTEEPTDEE